MRFEHKAGIVTGASQRNRAGDRRNGSRPRARDSASSPPRRTTHSGRVVASWRRRDAADRNRRGRRRSRHRRPCRRGRLSSTSGGSTSSRTTPASPTSKSCSTTPVEHLDHTLHVNVRGMFLVALASARAMAERGGGTIAARLRPRRSQGEELQITYNISKGGVAELVRSMAVDLAPSGVGVNAVAPDWVLTPRPRRSFPMTPSGRSTAPASRSTGRQSRARSRRSSRFCSPTTPRT